MHTTTSFFSMEHVTVEVCVLISFYLKIPGRTSWYLNLKFALHCTRDQTSPTVLFGFSSIFFFDILLTVKTSILPIQSDIPKRTITSTCINHVCPATLKLAKLWREHENCNVCALSWIVDVSHRTIFFERSKCWILSIGTRISPKSNLLA